MLIFQDDGTSGARHIRKLRISVMIPNFKTPKIITLGLFVSKMYTLTGLYASAFANYVLRLIVIETLLYNYIIFYYFILNDATA